MLLTTENSTQQINAALLDLEKETKSNTKNSIISTVYAIIKGFFDELKQKIGTTGIWSVTQAEYDSLTTSERLEDKYYNVTDASTGFLSVTNTVENGNTQPVTSNAVYGALTNKADKDYVEKNVFLSPITLPTDTMYTFNTDGYVFLSCSSTSGLSITCNIYGSNDNQFQVYTQSYMAFPIFVKKGMRIKITNKKTGTEAKFFPLG